MYQRTLDLAKLSQKKSLFLFGPRSTGKTTLLRRQFPQEDIINLLRSSLSLPLSQDPGYLRQLIRTRPRPDQPVIIDEIQKNPALLDEIHDLMETQNLRFVLTGSSARKLKNSGVNLLAGRAWQANLFPLCSAELAQESGWDNLDLDRYLLYGGLPQVVDCADPLEELDAYTNTYLQEEIRAESLVQNLNHFSAFLRTAALSQAEQINFTNLSRDAGIPASSVRAWFTILQDTFTGFLLEPWQGGRRKAVSTAKFYLFDIGAANYLAGRRSIPPSSTEYGKAFETFIAMELRAWLSYRRIKEELRYWRTREGLEVDFTLGTRLAVEVKASSRTHRGHLKGLRAIAQEAPFSQRTLVCLEEHPRQTDDGIRILPWRRFLWELWNNPDPRTNPPDAAPTGGPPGSRYPGSWIPRCSTY